MDLWAKFNGPLVVALACIIALCSCHAPPLEASGESVAYSPHPVMEIVDDQTIPLTTVAANGDYLPLPAAPRDVEHGPYSPLANSLLQADPQPVEPPKSQMSEAGLFLLIWAAITFAVWAIAWYLWGKGDDPPDNLMMGIT
jgi:hypothetical protein